MGENRIGMVCPLREGKGLMYIIPHHFTCWEPAAGLGDMVKPLREFFREVYASDIAEHNGGHEVADFLWPSDRRVDFVVTNPPFKLAEQFIATGLDRASIGVAMLVRSAFLEDYPS
jgi:hypothetical protein